MKKDTANTVAGLIESLMSWRRPNPVSNTQTFQFVENC
jgi:hypothetical protein